MYQYDTIRYDINILNQLIIMYYYMLLENLLVLTYLRPTKNLFLGGPVHCICCAITKSDAKNIKNLIE